MITKMENIRERMEKCKAHVDARSGLLYYKVWTSGSSVNYMYESDARYCLEKGKCWVTKQEAGAKRGGVPPHPAELYEPGSAPSPEQVRNIIQDVKPVRPELKGAKIGLFGMLLVVALVLWYFLFGRR